MYEETDKIGVGLILNPTVEDLRCLSSKKDGYVSEKVRFIINSNSKTVYVWDVSSYLHSDVFRYLGLVWGESNFRVDILYGVAEIKNNKLFLTDFQLNLLFSRVELWLIDIDIQNLSSFFSKDWSFVPNYFDGFYEHFENLKEQYLMIGGDTTNG